LHPRPGPAPAPARRRTGRTQYPLLRCPGPAGARAGAAGDQGPLPGRGLERRAGDRRGADPMHPHPATLAGRQRLGSGVHRDGAEAWLSLHRASDGGGRRRSGRGDARFRMELAQRPAACRRRHHRRGRGRDPGRPVLRLRRCLATARTRHGCGLDVAGDGVPDHRRRDRRRRRRQPRHRRIDAAAGFALALERRGCRDRRHARRRRGEAARSGRLQPAARAFARRHHRRCRRPGARCIGRVRAVVRCPRRSRAMETPQRRGGGDLRCRRGRRHSAGRWPPDGWQPRAACRQLRRFAPAARPHRRAVRRSQLWPRQPSGDGRDGRRAVRRLHRRRNRDAVPAVRARPPRLTAVPGAIRRASLRLMTTPSPAPTDTSQPALRRAVGRWQLFGLSINDVVGSGIYLLPAAAAALLGPASLWGILLAGLAVSLLVLCYAQAASYFDTPGGSYLYAREAFGPLVGFEIGWMLVLTRIASAAALSNGLAEAVTHFWPGAASGGARVAIVTGSIAFLVAINIFGVRAAARTGVLLAIAKMLPLLMFIAIGAMYVDMSQAAMLAADIPLADLGKAALLLLFAYAGFENLPAAAGEYRNPRRDVPFAMLAMIATVTAVYVAVQWVALGTLPGLAQSQTPLAEAASLFSGSWLVWVLTVGAAVSILGTTGNTMMLGPRYLLALANDG